MKQKNNAAAKVSQSSKNEKTDSRGKTKKNKASLLTTADLKGKQVDADPSTEEGKPLKPTE